VRNDQQRRLIDMTSSTQATRCSALALAATLLLAAGGGAAAQDKETIKLGFIGPLSGGNALQGLGARNGFLLAIEQANEGDYPYHVEGEVLDDASDPSTGVSAALKLVNDPGVVAAIGHWNSPVALATTPIFHQNGVPFIIWGAISPSITEQNFPEVTRTTPTLVQENEPLAKWLVDEAGMRQFAILSDTSDYGKQNTRAFTDYVEAAGGEIVAAEEAPVGTTDFRAILTRIRSLEPDGLYFGGVITEAGLVRKQMADLGMQDLPLIGISGIYDPKYLEIAGEAANGTIVSVPQVRGNAKLKAFEEAYEATDFDDPAGPYAKYAYDSTNILLEVIEQHGADDREELARAIRQIEYDGVLGTTTFDEQGQTEIEVVMEPYVVAGGEWVPWEQAPGTDSAN
jgi:branched-chain amino acid transport system substrate-binding protein